MTGFHSKREAAADKLLEPINLLEARRIAAEYRTPDSQVDDGNLYFALSKCLEHIDAQPAQEPVAHVYLFDDDGRPLIAWDNAKGVQIGDKLYTAPPQREWVGLTVQERNDCLVQADPCECLADTEAHQLMVEVEVKLRERNS
jgi:hypothetical protein